MNTFSVLLNTLSILTITSSPHVKSNDRLLHNSVIIFKALQLSMLSRTCVKFEGLKLNVCNVIKMISAIVYLTTGNKQENITSQFTNILYK